MPDPSADIAALRGIVGSAPTDALLHALLQRNGNNVNEAAAAYSRSVAELRASSAAAIAAIPVAVSEHERLALATYTYSFQPGRIGLVLSDSPDGVLVIDKEPGSPAAAAGVPLLSVVIGINGGSVAGLNRRGVGAKVAHALREGKLDIRVRHPAPDLGLPPPVTPTWANTPTPTPAALQRAQSGLVPPSSLSRTGVPLSTPQRAASMHLSGSGQRASSGGSTGSSERPSHAPLGRSGSGRSGSGRLSFGSSAHGGAPPRSMSFSGAARSLSRSLSLTSRRDRDRARSDTVRATAALLSNYAVDDGGIASPSSGASPGA